MSQDSLAIRTNAKGDAQVQISDTTNVITLLTGTTKTVPISVHDGTNLMTVTGGGAGRVDITSIAGTAPTTAGFIDIKGADGNVFVRQATAASLNAQVVGNVASAAADSGNPIKIGGVFNTTLPTLTTGQRGDIQLDSSARPIVVGAGTAGSAAGGIVTIQGVASMTAVKVDGSAFTQPVSGTVTANQGTANTNANGWFVKVTDGSNNVAVTSGSAIKADITTIAGTAPTTVGKLDVKGADGDVFVRQATASNLNATVTGSGTAGTPASGVVSIQGIANGTPVAVTFQGGIGTEKTDEQTFSALAPAGTTTLNFADVTVSTTGKLTQFVASSEVPMKVTFGTFDGTTYVVKRTIYTEAGIPAIIPMPNEDYVTMAGGTGKHFRAVVINNNPSGIGGTGSGAVSASWTEV